MFLAQRLLIFVVACVLAGCTQQPASRQADEPDGPAATVRHLSGLLQHNDLAGFARDAVPPQDYATFAQAWQQDLSRWPLDELPMPDKLVPMLAALSANDAERQLGQTFDRQLAGQSADLRSAAQTLGLFMGQYVKTQGDFSPDQRQHFAQVIPALVDWAQQAPLADAPRAHTALRGLVAAARATGFDSDTDLKAAGMQASLVKLDPFLEAFAGALSGYGLSLEQSLGKLETGTVTTSGHLAKVAVSYPLAGKPIHLIVTLRQQEGHWYVADYMDRATRLRKTLEAAPAPASDPASPEPVPAPPAAQPGDKLARAA